MTRPPALADWLLTRFGSVDDALIGDLYQEWAEGRSTIWFWHQTIAAIVWGAVRDIRRQPGRTCAALTAGWAVLGTIFFAGDTIAGAWVVARLYRSQPPRLLAYVAATFALLLTTGIVMDVLIRQGNRIPVVHPLFYAVSVTLQYQWYSGIFLVPLTMLMCGATALRTPDFGPRSDDFLSER